jgi:ATP-dependent RNA helicase TDRD9
VKLRTVLRIFPLNLASDESSKSFASYFKIGKYNGEGKLEYNAKYIKYPGRVFLPTRTTTQMYGYISHFKENGNFFFQTHHAKHGDFKDSRYVELSQQLDSLMQSIQLKSFNNPIDQFDINKMVVMIINDRKVRAKIVKVRPLTVYIIDEGKCFEVKYTNSIKDFASKEEKEKVMDFPPQCFECRMMGIQPSLGDSANRNWAPETIKMLSALANQKATLIIHSVVGDVAAVDLISQKECWNDVLLVQGKAEECEEPHANKLNLSIRRHVQNGENVIPPEEEFKGKIDGEVVITKSLPKRVCTISANLKGPFSPLETKLRGLTQITSQNSSVANTSVNHILLNDEILDKKKKVYVAANITTSKSSMGTSFQVHETSLIPQINGLSTIIAMIFSPMVQIRRDDKKKKFVSILCGLGFDLKSKESLYPQHDVAIDMDVKMSPQDIQKINSMRVNISKLLYTSPKDEFPALNDNEKNKIIDEINAIFQQIITKKFQKDSNILPKDPFKWNVDQTDAFLEYHSPADASILPTINIPKIEFSNHQEDNELKKHALELENIANRNSNHRERICRFCNFKWDNNIELSFHLTTPRHMKKVQSLLKQI